MSSADMMMVGVERVSALEFVRLEACVKTWRVCWGLKLTHCLRLEDERDAFILIAERTYKEALDHLEEVLRATFPDHVIVLRSYVQGFHLPVYTLDQAGMEQMDRQHTRLSHIVREARQGRPSPLLPPKRQELSGVAAWREWNHLPPQGRGNYLICDACGDSTARHPTEAAAWTAAAVAGWKTEEERGLCYCPTCLMNGNVRAAELSEMTCLLPARSA